MTILREYDPVLGELYLAGERVPPGVYQEIHRHHQVLLTGDDILPASLDGQVACYARVPSPWRPQLAKLARA